MAENDAMYYTLLANRAKTDEQAFVELYQHFFPRIYNFVYSRLKNTVDADDVTSDVFLKMSDHLDRFDAKKASFSTWLFRIATNAVTDQARRTQKLGETEWNDVFSPEAPDSETPEANALHEEGNEELLKALDKLSEREKKIVEMRYFMDAEFGFIAETLDMKPGAVRTALHRALEKLKEILGEEGL